jgi:acyl carrier protein
VPIGYPIANTTAYVFDDFMQPVPTFIAGQLYLGGDGLARGYLNRPELTAERFIPDPFSREPGARLYRTGDLVRRLPDGRLEFLGRRDTQVKVRGFRIELGEVEAVLSQHPAFREAVVIARSDEAGGKNLVAYLVAAEGAQVPELAKLRSSLREKLPDYAVPTAFVFLDELPLTPNGKVDRAALPAPSRSSLDRACVYVAPRTPLEQTLAQMWVEVFGLDEVGIHDNFFDLGGHSLLATQLASRLRAIFRVELPLRRLFETPTIAELAEAIEHAQQLDASPQMPAIVARSRESHRRTLKAGAGGAAGSRK